MSCDVLIMGLMHLSQENLIPFDAQHGTSSIVTKVHL